MSLDPERIKEVFARAVQLTGAAEQARFLTETCQAEPGLRAQVESLLLAHEQAGDFLGKTVKLTDSDFVIERTGTMIGRYKLLEKIGEGGFGSVYMAEQIEPLQRKVALKVIKAGMDTQEVIARFEAERQALAVMDHPNIARVLDAGATEAGRPYFVMELVRGIPITSFCDQKSLSTAERLYLFMKVCHAVQHAHQKGIIHRDLKPNNVLVTLHDGEPVPKVIDFGVAKALGQKLTEKTLFTAFQQLIGTPAYMSPEQAELSGLDVDTRSDIYSLGVLLYELLTGVTPFDAETLRQAAMDEMRRMIRETEPPKPSTRLQTLGNTLTSVARHRQTEPATLRRLVRGDLDWIVMKALEKDRRRRYETPDSFASDVARHIADEPVLAGPPSAMYRLGKFARRHRSGLAVTSALLVLLLSGTAVSIWEAVRAARAERLQIELRQNAETEARKSQRVAQFLKDMLQGVGPSVAMGRDTTMLREILDRTTEQLDEDLKNQPDVVAELRSTLAWVYFDLGDDLAAETFHRQALTLRRQLRSNQREAVADSLHGLGHALWRQGKLAEAEKVQRDALDLRRKTLGNDNLDTARSLNDLALVLYSQGRLPEAEALCRESLSIRKRLLPELHRDVGHTLQLLGLTLAEEGKLAEAEALHREALAMRQRLFGNKHPDIAFSLAALGAVLAKQGKLPDAESLLNQSLSLQRELQRDDHPESLFPLCTLAKLLATQGRLAEAAALCRMTPGSSDAAIYNRIAWPLATCVHAPVRDGSTAVSFAEKAVTATNRKDVECLETLAAAYAEVGQFAKAVSAAKEAMALLPDGKQKAECEFRLRLYETNSPYRQRGYENILR